MQEVDVLQVQKGLHAQSHNIDYNLFSLAEKYENCTFFLYLHRIHAQL